jgi:gluconokinase
MSTAALPHPSDNGADTRLTVVVMGVAGSGKSTVGAALGQALSIPFVDGDDLHSSAARAKMTSGTGLTDEDRMPWLDRIGATLADADTHPAGVIVACSALKRIYRQRLRERVGAGLRFLFLDGDASLMRARVAARPGHFMPASLVESQFATLERPDGETDVVTLAADADLESGMADLVDRLRQSLAQPFFGAERTGPST